MRGWTQVLFGVAGLCFLASVLLISWDRGTLAPDAVGDALLRLANQAFPPGPWRWGGVAAIACACLAVSTTGISILQSWIATQGAPKFEPLATEGTRQAVSEVRRRVLECVAGDSPHVVAAVNEIVRGAVAVTASDIHLSPTPSGLSVTYRVHGTLCDVVRIDRSFAAPMSARVKVLAQLDTYVRGIPQDGRLVLSLDGKSIEARVSTLPTETGERVVLRLVRGSVEVPDLGALGFAPGVLDGVSELLAKPQGLIFVTGPVGSGKTTTLYAALKHIASTRGTMTTMVTLEDPIEIELPFATQTQMRPKAGMTFAGTLRSVLRQDPNVLMLGEIRDHETAEIAMQAGLTGHLILTTVHGEGAAGPFARLMEMRVEPFVVASASLGCLSQRLVRVLCTACRRETEPEGMHRERFEQLGVTLPEGQYFEPRGCELCEGQGYTGRTPIAELLRVTPEIREAVNRHAPTTEIAQLARAQGMVPVVIAGLERARRGTTSLTEVLRVAG